MNQELKKEIIMENYLHPYNYEPVNDNAYLKVNNNSENCIDDIDLYILFENNLIKDIKFQGEACAISTSSTSIMIKNLIGKSIPEAKEYIKNYLNMINEQPYDKDILKEALCYEDIYKQQNRKNCALLPYMGILKLMKEYEEKQNN